MHASQPLGPGTIQCLGQAGWPSVLAVQLRITGVVGDMGLARMNLDPTRSGSRFYSSPEQLSTEWTGKGITFA